MEYTALEALFERGTTGTLTIHTQLNAWGRKALTTTRVLADIDGKVSVFILDGGPTLNPAGDRMPVIYFPAKIRPAETFLTHDKAGLRSPEDFTRGRKDASFSQFYRAQGAIDRVWIAGGFGLLFLVLSFIWAFRALR